MNNKTNKIKNLNFNILIKKYDHIFFFVLYIFLINNSKFEKYIFCGIEFIIIKKKEPLLQ
jgi:hypothetical protein